MSTSDVKEHIEQVIREMGPLKGADLQKIVPQDPLVLWRACRLNPNLSVMTLGRRFLRLDRSVDGFARLSPSIRREFLTYSVVGVRGEEAKMRLLLERIGQQCQVISQNKSQLAQDAMAACLEGFKGPPDFAMHICCVLAGDVVYGLAHDVPRPERSTGQLVRGSDLDLIIVTSDELDPESVRRFDDQILKKKHYLLVHPDYREEIDYILKPLSRIREQARFDTFEHMVACKILNEGRHLLGNRTIFDAVKHILSEKGIPEKLAALERKAECDRTSAEEHLLTMAEEAAAKNDLHLFYTREESEEIY